MEPIDYRLPLMEALRLTDACQRTALGEEIIVCGRRTKGELGHLKPDPEWLPRRPGEVVGVDLPFGRIEPAMSTSTRSDGWVDKRVMVKVKIPF